MCLLKPTSQAWGILGPDVYPSFSLPSQGGPALTLQPCDCCRNYLSAGKVLEGLCRAGGRNPEPTTLCCPLLPHTDFLPLLFHSWETEELRWEDPVCRMFSPPKNSL